MPSVTRTKARLEALIQLLPQRKRLPDKLLPTFDSTSVDQSSSSTGFSDTLTAYSISAAGASVSSGKGAGLWFFKDMATMTSNIYAAWAYDCSDDSLAKFFMGTASVGFDQVAIFNSSTNYSALASTLYKEVVDGSEPDDQTAQQHP